jgi:hypothetical protein
MKAYRGSRGNAPYILKLGTIWGLLYLYHAVIHWIEKWVGLGTRLNLEAKIKISATARNQTLTDQSTLLTGPSQ